MLCSSTSSLQMYSWWLQDFRTSVLLVVIVLTFSTFISAAPLEQLQNADRSAQQENQSYSQFRPPRISTHKIRDTLLKHVSRCNYEELSSPTVNCFGFYEAKHDISYIFEDGIILDTSITVSCIGNYTNQTSYSNEFAEVKTICAGQFHQVQTMETFEPVIVTLPTGEDLISYEEAAASYYSSYSCRNFFTNQRQHVLEGYRDPDLYSGRVEMQCVGEQSVQIQKGCCECTKKDCAGEFDKNYARDEVFSFRTQFETEDEIGIAKSRRREEDDRFDVVHEMFKQLSLTDRDLAIQVSEKLKSVLRSKSNELSPSDVHPVFLNPDISNADRRAHWSTNPPTSWLDVQCNGKPKGFASECDGLLLAQPGEARVWCNGKWRAFEDHTYVCEGDLGADEAVTIENSNSSQEKLNVCTGNLAVYPLSTARSNKGRYYGLNEVCKGRSHVIGWYSIDQVDYRYFSHVVDPKITEQLICLLADKNCQYLLLSA